MGPLSSCGFRCQRNNTTTLWGRLFFSCSIYRDCSRLEDYDTYVRCGTTEGRRFVGVWSRAPSQSEKAALRDLSDNMRYSMPSGTFYGRSIADWSIILSWRNNLTINNKGSCKPFVVRVTLEKENIVVYLTRICTLV